MRTMLLAAFAVACLSSVAAAQDCADGQCRKSVRHSILNTQSCSGGACQSGASEGHAFRAPLRTALREVRPVRRLAAAVLHVVHHRPRVLRRLACRALGGCR